MKEKGKDQPMSPENKTQHLVSIGQLCQQFQRSYFDVLKTLSDRAVRPVLTLDLVPFFDFDEAFRSLDRSRGAAHD